MNSTAAANGTWPSPVYPQSLAAAMVSIGRMRLPPESIRCSASFGISSTSETALSRIRRFTAPISSATSSRMGVRLWDGSRVSSIGTTTPTGFLFRRLLTSVILNYGFRNRFHGRLPHSRFPDTWCRKGIHHDGDSAHEQPGAAEFRGGASAGRRHRSARGRWKYERHGRLYRRASSADPGSV